MRTRETLVRVAFELFREYGYDDTTVDVIARSAGVSARTFFRHFPFKDLLVAERAAAVTDEVLSRIVDDMSVQGLVATYAAVMEQAMTSDDFHLVARLLHDHERLVERVPVWRQLWVDRLAAGLAALAGQQQPTTAHRLTSILTLQLVAVALDEWLADPTGPTIRERAQEIGTLAVDQLTSSADSPLTL